MDVNLTVNSGVPLKGRVHVPGDKSISHRAVLMGALCDGVTHVDGWLAAGDTEASLSAVKALGVKVEREGLHKLAVHGGKLQEPSEALNLVNAGTGIRLLTGIMVGQPFPSVLDGSGQLRRRPMKRIIEPLSLMGAIVEAEDGRAPLRIRPASLKGIEYAMPMASAQVKSSILLAGLFAEGETTVIEPGPARDHTELMLKAMGADLTIEENRVTIKPGNTLKPMNLTVPGDFSSAAFLIVAALVVPDSDIVIEHVNLNDTRTGLLDVLLEMGADITVHEKGREAGERVGDIHVKHSPLKGVEVGGDVVVRMIDEFPILMVAALCAEGQTIVRDAQELRVKETDRIAVMSGELRLLGAAIEEREDGFIINGPQRLNGKGVNSYDDHRVAMSMSVAGLFAEGITTIYESRCASDSFPGFPETLLQLGAKVQEDVYPAM